jgi:hypothetical protein
MGKILKFFQQFDTESYSKAATWKEMENIKGE